MKETEFLSEMDKYGFQNVGKILCKADHLAFNLTRRCAEHGCVYLWIENSGQVFTVVYVGKAGRTLHARCQQHKGGFRRSSTGKAHAGRLRKGFIDNKCYDVYARKADNATLFGEDAVSMACVEERVFIKKFQPTWNAAW